MWGVGCGVWGFSVLPKARRSRPVNSNQLSVGGMGNYKL
ncbi:hypothetical protein N0824_02229 [Microcystis sp. 0824]|nr:hypothetical protein N0824_02229 [Microcystis sp. 0824]